MDRGVQQSKMGSIVDNNRRTAALVGVLYIIGTVAGVLSRLVTWRFADDPGLLGRVAAHADQAAAGALLTLVMGLALVMVPVLMFPILRRQNEALALGYVVFRGALEFAAYVGMALCWLLLVVVAKQAAGSGGAVVSQLHGLGQMLFDAQAPIGAVTSIVFGVGALMFSYLLYASRLVPRWISVWGLVSAVVSTAVGVSALFGTNPEVLYMPLAVQEMVLAVWLIAKGFNRGPSPPRATLGRGWSGKWPTPAHERVGAAK
jgi:hypothetical protein